MAPIWVYFILIILAHTIKYCFFLLCSRNYIMSVSSATKFSKLSLDSGDTFQDFCHRMIPYDFTKYVCWGVSIHGMFENEEGLFLFCFFKISTSVRNIFFFLNFLQRLFYIIVVAVKD